VAAPHHPSGDRGTGNEGTSNSRGGYPILKVRNQSSFPGIATVDFCLNLVLVFAVLAKLSSTAVQTKQVEQKKSAPTNALYMIKVEWAGDAKSDVDTYVADPDKHLVYFKRLSDGLMVLDHDDTGQLSNQVTLSNGEVVQSALNEETVELRGQVVPGEYVCNVQMYAMRDPTPVKVSISLYKTSGSDDMKVHNEIIVLSKKGQEATAFRFTLMKDGDVVDVNRLQKRFVGPNGGI
jgi:hypothetical protein